MAGHVTDLFLDTLTSNSFSSSLRDAGVMELLLSAYLMVFGISERPQGCPVSPNQEIATKEHLQPPNRSRLGALFTGTNTVFRTKII